MIFRRSGPKSSAKKRLGPSAPDGKRAYAIGDVHGCFDELQDLIRLIEQDNAARAPAACHIVFLGDLIDRGPKSREVIDFLMSSPPAFANCHFITGNHEESLVRAVSGEPNLIEPWLQHGGTETAASYGLEPGSLIGQSEPALEHLLISAIPRSHIQFLSEFLECIRFGDYFFVHAGVRPGVALEQQSARDMRWIRGQFLDSDKDFGAVVVHGHTITETVAQKPNRIGIDTGAYRTGVLTAICLDGDEQTIIQTSSSPAD